MGELIDKLIQEVIAKHRTNPPLSDAQIAHHEGRLGFRLPEDLRRFYENCNGAWLFKSPASCPYRLLPLEEVKRTRVCIFDEDADEWAPSSWYAICDVMDGNYVGIDFASPDGKTYSIIDCFHETHGIPGHNKIIAQSFSEFLRLALSSSGDEYWLREGFVGYGDALEPKSSGDP